VVDHYIELLRKGECVAKKISKAYNKHNGQIKSMKRRFSPGANTVVKYPGYSE
jgi:hypothetical protein